MARTLTAALVALSLVAPTSAFAWRLGSPIPLMMALRERGAVRPEWDRVLPSIARDEVGLTVRLHGDLDGETAADIEATGARLRRDERGRPWRLGRLCAVNAPWESVPALARIGAIERIELARAPGSMLHLDVSVPEIEASQAWEIEDYLGQPVDGTGVVAADFDSGIDVFHPMFFHLDGGIYEWIDMGGDGRFDPGEDAVDLDGDGREDEGERLVLLEGVLLQNGRAWQDGYYDTDVDWLFVDTDLNGERDYGPEAGYTDLDPSFGEMIFVTDDANGNGQLDVGELLIGLGTSKLLATLVWPDTMRYRGVDLIETPVVDSFWETHNGRDTRADHGTGVTSILGGGWSGAGRRVTGVAPGVELVLVDFNNDMGLAATIPWVISFGALVGAHPYGHKVFSFLDGSSNDELAIDTAYEEHNALQVVSVGNEAANRDDASATIPGEGTVPLLYEVLHYEWTEHQITFVAQTIRWNRSEVMLSFSLVDPEENRQELGSRSGSASIGATYVEYSREDSPRGTAKFDIITAATSGFVTAGAWAVEIHNPDSEPVTVVATMMNDRFRGAGTNFTGEDQVDIDATVSAYATADMAIGACSYGTRHSFRGEVIGQLSGFSSRGPRIDGFRIVDICAPGDNDIIWAASSRHSRPVGAYTFGGGTSASAPHVAGGIALLQQAAPWATAAEVEEALYGGALIDDFTTEEIPNHSWGWGKIRIMSSIALLPEQPEVEEEVEEIDRTPWENDRTPDAGLPQPPTQPAPLVGVEGGGCHCRSAGVSGSISSHYGRDDALRQVILGIFGDFLH